MRCIPPATNLLAPIDVQTLRDLWHDAHHSYARCPDNDAPRFAAAIVDLELELLRRNVAIDAPPEPDVQLGNLNQTLRHVTALQRIRRAAKNGDVETFCVSIYHLSPAGVLEAWDCAYAFRAVPHKISRLLEMLFITALAQREGWPAACAVCEDLVRTKETLTSFITTLECALRDLLKVAPPHGALINSFVRWRQDVD